MVARRPGNDDDLMSTMSLPDQRPVPLDPLRAGPVIVGFDGSPAAARALDRAATALGHEGRMLVVAVEPHVHSRGLLSESLLEQVVNADVLLDFARDRVGASAPSLELEPI